MTDSNCDEIDESVDQPLGRYRIRALLKASQSELVRRFGIEQARLFGSTARGEATADSDIDILVRFRGDADLKQFFEAKEYIETILGHPVDLVDESALREELRPRIEAEAKQDGTTGGEREWRLYMRDIRESIIRIEEHTVGMDGSKFLENRTVADAVLMRLSVIGRAAKLIPRAIRKQHSHIPWHQLSSVDEMLPQDDPESERRAVWRVVRHELPKLREPIAEIISESTE